MKHPPGVGSLDGFLSITWNHPRSFCSSTCPFHMTSNNTEAARDVPGTHSEKQVVKTHRQVLSAVGNGTMLKCSLQYGEACLSQSIPIVGAA